MGCDIHPFVEVRRYETWWFFGIPDDDRMYGFFAALSGVRGRYADDSDEDGAPADKRAPLRRTTCGYDPREAWPEDLCYMLRDAVDPASRRRIYVGDHSFCHATLAEMIAFDPQFRLPLEAEPLHHWQRWIKFGEFAREYWNITDADVRFLWGFDN